jgi:Flp pilus assembly protein TadG
MPKYRDQLTSKPRRALPSFSLKNNSQTGQSLVEFSLMGIILLILLAGVMDLGRAYFTYLALKDAAAEGAYYGQAHPAWVDGNYSGAGTADDDPNNILYRVKNSAPQGGLVNWDGATVTVDVVNPPVPGQTLTVTVSYPYQLITPFIGGQTLTLTARAVSVIVSPP